MTARAVTPPRTAPAPGTTAASGAKPPPSPGRVLAVTARPGQESADLGGLLFAFRRSGASLSLLCLTQGENADALGEVQQAGAILGIRQVSVADYPDGGLHHYRSADVAERVKQAAAEYAADLILVVAPETGDIADAAVARAALAAALQVGLPVMGRTRAGVSGSWPLDLGADAEVARMIQRAAAAEHVTQVQARPALTARLDELGSQESARWLLSPARLPEQHAR